MALGPRQPAVAQGQLDVLKCRGPGQEVEILENKAELAAADVGQLVGVEP
jgi:hypothetical protein